MGNQDLKVSVHKYCFQAETILKSSCILHLQTSETRRAVSSLHTVLGSVFYCNLYNRICTS